MGSVADLFPPGIDLCQIPGGTAPNGEVSDFQNEGLKSTVTAICVFMTVIAIIFGFGRLYVNSRKPSWSDLFVLIVILCNVADMVVMVIFSKYFRHTWDLPICWLNGQYQQLQWVWENLLNFSLFFAKIATLMLLRQLFTISRPMSRAIWVGMALTFGIYTAGLIVTTYTSAPHIGQTWDEVMAASIVEQSAGGVIFPLKWSIAQGAASTLLDLYIFILPLPTISRLQLSLRKKTQILALFFVALLAVVASVVSLAYRVKTVIGASPDSMWNTAVLLTCNLAEMDASLIICSAPAFASLIRTQVIESRAFQTIRSTLGRSSNGGIARSKVTDPNTPRTKSKHDKPSPYSGYIEMNDTWLINKGSTADVEALRPTPETGGEHANALRVFKTIDIERATNHGPSHGQDGGTSQSLFPMVEIGGAGK